MSDMQTVTPPPAPTLDSTVISVSGANAARPFARARTGAARTLGHQLERDRLEQRATRVRQVIHALRERAQARDATGAGRPGPVPRPLRAAIEDFGRELAELERRLRHHEPTG